MILADRSGGQPGVDRSMPRHAARRRCSHIVRNKGWCCDCRGPMRRRLRCSEGCKPQDGPGELGLAHRRIKRFLTILSQSAVSTLSELAGQPLEAILASLDRSLARLEAARAQVPVPRATCSYHSAPRPQARRCRVPGSRAAAQRRKAFGAGLDELRDQQSDDVLAQRKMPPEAPNRPKASVLRVRGQLDGLEGGT